MNQQEEKKRMAIFEQQVLGSFCSTSINNRAVNETSSTLLRFIPFQKYYTIIYQIIILEIILFNIIYTFLELYIIFIFIYIKIIL